MRALVTGAAGFLGSHLCDRLRRDGIEVLGCDNFYTGRRANISHLDRDSGFNFFEHDVTRPLDAGAVGPLDLIFNMACPGSPPAFQRDPVFTLDTNYLGVRNLWNWHATKKQSFCRPPPARSTAIPRSIPRTKATGATSIVSAHAVATTRASGSPRR